MRGFEQENQAVPDFVQNKGSYSEDDGENGTSAENDMADAVQFCALTADSPTRWLEVASSLPTVCCICIMASASQPACTGSPYGGGGTSGNCLGGAST